MERRYTDNNAVMTTNSKTGKQWTAEDFERIFTLAMSVATGVNMQVYDVYYPGKSGVRVATVIADECKVKVINGGRNFKFVRAGELIARFRDVRVYDESGNEVTE